MRNLFTNQKKKIILVFIACMFYPGIAVLTFATKSQPAVLTVSNDWGSGFTGKIDLTNTTSNAYNSWQLEFDFPYNISSIWSAKIKSHAGNRYVIENENWNGAIPPGSTISFGFQGTPGNVTHSITNITVNGISVDPPNENSPPFANNDTATTNQDTPVSINVLTNDTDADNDSLYISSVTSPSNGIASIQSSSINYIPNTNFYGSDSFEYTINDGNGGVDTAVATINVNQIISPPLNLPPTANNDTVETRQNTPVSIKPLSNDTDPENDTLTISSTTIPANGTAVILGSNIIYTPANNYAGTDAFSYTIADTSGNTATALVSVTVPPNNGGTTEGFAYNITTDWGTGFNGEITISNLTTEISTGWAVEFDYPYNLTQIWSAEITAHTGNHYKIKNVDWNAALPPGASTTLGFGATPGNATAEPTNVRISIIHDSNPDPVPPVANNDTASTEENETVTINVLSNDTGEQLNIDSITIPAHGTATTSNNAIVYIPETDYAGNDTFSYTVIDSQGQTANATVSITVTKSHTPVNPLAANDNTTAYINTPVTIDALANDTGNGLTINNVDTPNNGTAVISNHKIIYTPTTDFTETDTFNYTIQNEEGLTDSGLISVTVREPSNINKAIVGYWQNWFDERYIKLGDVPSEYNIIDIAFALPKSETDMTVVFNLDTAGTSAAEFKSDIKQIQAEGRKVIISLGGATSPSVRLNTDTDKQKFISSIINIIEEYGFNGLDIDLEGGSVGLNPGDNDFKNPTTPSMINLINAIKEIHDHFGSENFMLTSAPETAYVQGGYGGYNGFWGAYLPLLYGLRNELDLIHVQYYNSGSIYGADGQVYYPGTPDFLVALSESLLKGFPVNRDPNNIFPPFRPDQIAIGLLTVASEGSGHMQYTEINQALDYLTKGIPYGGQYILQQAGGYPDFGGIMGWSINYDKSTNNYSFANNAYDYFYGSEPVPNRIPIAGNDDIETPINTAITINVLENDTDEDGDILTISTVNTPLNGTVEIVSSSIVYTPKTGFTGSDTFDYTVSDGNEGSASATVTITVNNDPISNTYTITASVINSGEVNNYPDFVQPMAGDTLYIIGDRVTFNGNIYESCINSNSWSPTGYPGGWKIISGAGDNSANGTITPSGESTLDEGQSLSFTISPATNCTIKEVKVDDISQGALNTYTFSSVDSNHTITAEFMANTTPSPNISPTVAFNTPLNNAVITQTTLAPINISVNAQDSDGTIVSVTINIDGNVFSGPIASWTPSDYGIHRIMVTAIDNEGAESTGLLTVTVQNQNTPATERKQVIGYFTQWEPWFGTEHGYPEQGVANQLNIDYSKFTILNYSFFGVAEDGSLHSGDFRNKDIYKDGITQEPSSLLFADVYSSWDYHLLFGELDYINDFNDPRIADLGYQKILDKTAGEFGYKSANSPSYALRTDIWYNTNTKIYGLMPIPVPKPGGKPGLIQLCKDNNVKLMASIGGWSMCKHFPEMAADPIKREKFINDCKRLIDMGFAGIDIDWEYPDYEGMNIENFDFSDYANFTTLMEEIRDAIGPDKLLTAAFSCVPARIENMEWNKLNSVMNYYNMMTYDMDGGWSDRTGHNSALYGTENTFSWDKTFRYLTEEKGIAPEKINMGIAFYGRGVVTNNAASLGATTHKIDMVIDPDGPVNRASDLNTWGKYFEQPNYFYIKQKTTNWTHFWDDFAKVPYATNGNSFISYDNEESVRLKAEYVMNNQIAGVIIWHVTGDWEVGPVTETYGGKLKKAQVNTPLLDTIHNVFTSDIGDDDNNDDIVVNNSFPQHINYPLSHILPNNYSQTAMDSDVKNYYDYWKQNYLINAGTNSNGKQMYRISYNGDTVSEGQGYGMIITALMAGHDPEAKNIFDGLWLFAKSMPSEINSNFMDWSLATTTGNDSAFDGDCDIAYALLIADKQWGSASGINYKYQADTIINAMRNNLFSNSTNLPFLGDWVSQNDSYWNTVSRPSDFMLANFRAFDNSINNSDWNEVIVTASQAKLQYLQSNYSPTTGLIPDFIKNGNPALGQVLESNNDGKYNYNACRVPMRVGMDALLSNNATSKAIAEKISTWAEESTSGNINNFYAGYNLNGTPYQNYVDISFTAPLGVAAMCSNQQTWLNNIYSSVRTNHSGAYYGDTLNLISMLIMTGNFWDSTIVQ